jgi:integrase
MPFMQSTQTRNRGFIPEIPAEWATLAPAASKAKAKPGKTVTIKADLTDARIEARQEFSQADGPRTMILHDFGGTQSVAGLRCRIGPRSATWIFYRDVLDHGERKITSKTLGHFGLDKMTTADARNAARIIAGRLSGGSFEPSNTNARKFADAFASYLDYLQAKADDAGKPARWRNNVEHLGNSIMLPKWGHWSLLDMSKRREDVGEWHKGIVKSNGVTSANHCVRIIRAVYLRAAKRDDSLPGDPTKLPSAAVTMRREKWQKQSTKDKPGLAFRDFPAWRAAWQALPPIRRAYHLTGLLTGARPGELARTPWSNLDCRHRALTIGNAKAGNDIPIPLSAAICRALKLARDNRPRRILKAHKVLIFPGCEQAARDDLPARGNALRRTFKTLSFDCGVSDDLSAFLLGHLPEGMSAKYALRRMLLDGPALRKHQRTISRRIMSLLGD